MRRVVLNTLICFSKSNLHVSSSTFFSSLSLASFSAPVSLAAYVKKNLLGAFFIKAGLRELYANYDFSTKNSISPFGAFRVLFFLLVLVGSRLQSLISYFDDNKTYVVI